MKKGESEIVRSLRDFSERYRNGEDFAVDELSQEDTPDGPLTNRVHSRSRLRGVKNTNKEGE